MKPREGPNPRGYATDDFNLRARLEALGIPQIRFADFINRDHSGVRRWIAGKYPAPREVQMIVDILDHHILGAPLPTWVEEAIDNWKALEDMTDAELTARGIPVED